MVNHIIWEANHLGRTATRDRMEIAGSSNFPSYRYDISQSLAADCLRRCGNRDKSVFLNLSDDGHRFGLRA
jgi:hypothetical protein